MKLLFDQNLSFKLCRRLASEYPQSVQVREVGLDQADDEMVWNYAGTNGFTIVTQDGDFPNISLLRRWPPKVIWLRGGNRPTTYIEQLLRSHQASIVRFISDPTAGVLELA